MCKASRSFRIVKLSKVAAMCVRNVTNPALLKRLRPCIRLFSAIQAKIAAQNAKLAAQETNLAAQERKLAAQETTIAALGVDLRYAGKFVASIVLRELKDDFRHRVWSIQYPKKSFDSGMYSKWVACNANEEGKVVPFVNNLLPHDCKQRALLTWGTLRALSKPTCLGNSIPAYEPQVDEIAYAVTTTKHDDHGVPFDVYEMVLIALGREDVLEYMQREEMQMLSTVEI